MNRELIAIFEYFECERGIKREIVVQSIEEALLIAARKVTGANNITVTIDPKSGDIKVIAEREVVDKITYPEEEILIADARLINPQATFGDTVAVPINADHFGRIAAQIAKQVIFQKLRQAERDVIYSEYRDRVGEVLSGTVKRISKNNTVIVDLGKIEAVLPSRFCPREETYQVGDRVLALLLNVQDTESGGAEVVLSRSAPEFVLQLMMQEIPELRDGTITVRKIVREAGLRTMIALDSGDPKVDPVGACIGMRGHRIKNILRELGTEKIDLFPFAQDTIQLLKNALHPIIPKKIEVLDEFEINIIVDDASFAAALGKRGHHARLISKILEKDVNFFKQSDYERQVELEREELAALEHPVLDDPIGSVPGINQFVAENLVAAGLETLRIVLAKQPAEIAASADISLAMAEDLIEQLRKYVRAQLG